MGPSNSENGEQGHIEKLYNAIESLETIDLNICKYFSNRLPKWHALNPDFLVLTARSATVYQPLIKRAWTKIYDSEKKPGILNVDPHILLPDSKLPDNALPAEKLTTDSRVLIFDEISGAYNDMGKPQKYVFAETDKAGAPHTLDAVANYVHSLGISDIWIDTSHAGLWGNSAKGLLQRKATEQGEVLERRRDRTKIHEALEYANKMRTLGDLVSEIIKNKLIV